MSGWVGNIEKQKRDMGLAQFGWEEKCRMRTHGREKMLGWNSVQSMTTRKRKSKKKLKARIHIK